jgi:hypothetical protein
VWPLCEVRSSTARHDVQGATLGRHKHCCRGCRGTAVALRCGWVGARWAVGAGGVPVAQSPLIVASGGVEVVLRRAERDRGQTTGAQTNGACVQHESRRATATGRAIEGGVTNQKNTRYGETPGHSAEKVFTNRWGCLCAMRTNTACKI